MTAVGDTVGTIAGARLAGTDRALLIDEGPVDVFIHGAVIVDIAPAGALRARGTVLDAAGGFVVPGLWDHHVHVTQWALLAERTSLAGAESAAHAARIMAGASVRSDGRRIGVGFRDALWPDAVSLSVLDAATGGIPTYLINADVHSVWLNSAALRREGRTPDGTGLLREADAFDIERRLDDLPPGPVDELVKTMARDAAARGVVGIVDLDMAWNEAVWTRRSHGGFDALRVEFGIYPDLLGRAVAEGLRTGDVAREAASDLMRVGAVKVITDGSLGTRTAAVSRPYPHDRNDFGLLTVDPASLVDAMTQATAAGLACAIHAIGDVANTHALDAFAVTGATGTIEHAQLVAHADIPRFARLGVGASIQPVHALDDRDIAEAAWGAQTAQPFPLRALAAAGASVLFGSDAPVAALDPWAAVAAAVYRTRDTRAPWHPDQRVDAATALAASTHGGSGDPAQVTPGAVADLVLCGADPATLDESALRRMPVSATLLGGRLTHLS